MNKFIVPFLISTPDDIELLSIEVTVRDNENLFTNTQMAILNRYSLDYKFSEFSWFDNKDIDTCDSNNNYVFISVSGAFKSKI